MYWFRLWAALSGSVLAAIAVRMVAGTPAGLVTIAVLIIEQLIAPGSSFVLPLALVIFALLEVNGVSKLSLNIASVTASLTIACVWNGRAAVLLPVAAGAFVFRTLTPDPGLRPFSELWVAWRQNRLAVSSAVLLVLLLPAGLAVCLGRAEVDWRMDSRLRLTLGDLPGSLVWLTAPLAVVVFAWLLTGVREANGAVVALAGLPLASLAVDPRAAQGLLPAAGIALGALTLRSYRLKRHS